MEIKELGHIVLFVGNLARSVTFYRDVLGWRQIVHEPDGPRPRAAFCAPGGRTHHELLLFEVGEDAPRQPEGRRIGLYHVGLKIGDTDDDLRAALAKLREAGTPILGMSDHTVSHSLYVADPDGNEIELYVDVAGVDWINQPELVTAPTKPLHL